MSEKDLVPALAGLLPGVMLHDDAKKLPPKTRAGAARLRGGFGSFRQF